jgi:hypothetical protein
MALDAQVAAETIEQAERAVLDAEASFARVRDHYQSGRIEPEDWAQQRPDLQAAFDAARAAAEQAAQVAAQGPALDAEAEMFRRMADLRAAVTDGVRDAAGLDGLRRLLRHMFEAVHYMPVVEDAPGRGPKRSRTWTAGRTSPRSSPSACSRASTTPWRPAPARACCRSKPNGQLADRIARADGRENLDLAGIRSLGSTRRGGSASPRRGFVLAIPYVADVAISALSEMISTLARLALSLSPVAQHKARHFASKLRRGEAPR